MALWLGFIHVGRRGFGQLAGDMVEVFEGNMFAAPRATGERLPVGDLQPDLPCQPRSFFGMWNNCYAQAVKQGLAVPTEPLWFIKAASCHAVHGQDVHTPAGYDGRVVYEGELGLVIGRQAKGLSVEQAADAIFGVTCVNDITALDLLNRDPSFSQWSRAKSFDGFGAFGPVIATGLDLQALSVRTLVNGRERQNYACSDMIFSPAQIVSALSQELTLQPGDLIACGTSLGVLPMKAGTVVEVVIDGVGTLRNTFAGQGTAAAA